MRYTEVIGNTHKLSEYIKLRIYQQLKGRTQMLKLNLSMPEKSI